MAANPWQKVVGMRWFDASLTVKLVSRRFAASLADIVGGMRWLAGRVWQIEPGKKLLLPAWQIVVPVSAAGL